MAYRSTPHSSTGYSPYFLVHGREPKLPGECSFIEETDSPRDYVNSMKRRLREAYKEARATEARTRGQRADQHDKGKKPRAFERGDKVYLLEPAVPVGHSRKFRRPWTGPHTILTPTSPVNYRIALSKGGTTVVHINRLKPAYERDGTEEAEECRLPSQGVQVPEDIGISSGDDEEERAPLDDDEIEVGPECDRASDESTADYSTESEDLEPAGWAPDEYDWEQTEAEVVARPPYQLRSRTREESRNDDEEGEEIRGPAGAEGGVYTRLRARPQMGPKGEESTGEPAS